MGNKILDYPNWEKKKKKNEQTNMQKVDKAQRILHSLNLYL